MIEQMRSHRLDLESLRRDGDRQQVAPIELVEDFPQSLRVTTAIPGEVPGVDAAIRGVDLRSQAGFQLRGIKLEKLGVQSRRADQDTKVPHLEYLLPARLRKRFDDHRDLVQELAVLRRAERSGPENLFTIHRHDPGEIGDRAQITKEPILLIHFGAGQQFDNRVPSSLGHQEFPAPRPQIRRHDRIGVKHDLHQHLGKLVLAVHRNQGLPFRPVLRIAIEPRAGAGPGPDQCRGHLDPRLFDDQLTNPCSP
ncbi:MAG: hypothetical protein CMJ67_06535 [Planctomycetaceae bacterium]|nr:hypothetical protein [Planctomycetaceae bacterium]